MKEKNTTLLYFEDLLSSVKVSAWVWSYPEERYLYVSPHTPSLYGICTTTIHARPYYWLEAVHPDDKSIAMGSLDQLLQEGAAEAEYRIVTPVGIRWLLDRKTLIRDTVGQPLRAEGLVIDITDKKNIEAQLQLSEKNYRQLFENNPIPLLAYDPDTLQVKMVNAAAIEEYGYTKEEFLQLTIKDLRPPAEIDKFLSFHQSLDYKELMRYSGEWIHRRKDGSLFYAFVANSKIELNDQSYRVAVVYNRTNEISAQKALEERELLLRHVSENYPNGTVAILDNAFRYLYTDGQEYRLYKTYPQTLIGTDYTLAFDPETAKVVRQYLERALGGEQVCFEIACHGQLYELCAAPIRNARHQIEKIIVVTQNITAKKAQLDHLRLLESVITNAHDAVLITAATPIDAPEGPKILFVNEALTRMTGYSQAEIIGQTPRILQGPLTDRKELDRIRAALESKQSVTAELINYKKNGAIFWVQLIIYPIIDEKGQCTHLVSIQRDVTESKKMQEKLYAANERYELVSQISNEAIWDHDVVTDKVQWNHGIRTIFGYDFKDNITTGKWWESKLHPEDRESVLQLFREKIREREETTSVEYRFICAQQQIKYVYDRARIFYENGQPVRLIGAMQDITAQKEIELELLRSEKRFKSLIQNGGDMVSLINTDAVYQYVSPSYSKILGIETNQIINKSAFDFIHPEDKERVYQEFLALKTQKSVRLSPFRFAHGEKEWIWLETIVTNLLDDSSVNAYVTNCRDITYRIEQERQNLQQAQQIMEISESIPGAIFQLKFAADGTISLPFISNSVKKLYGEKIEKSKTNIHELLSMLHPDDHALLIETITSSAHTLESFSIKCRFLAADASQYRWFRIAAMPSRLTDGSVTWNGTIVDVTKGEEAQRLVRENNERLKLVMKATNDAVWDWDLEKNTLYYSDNYSEMFGYEMEEQFINVNHWQERIHPDDYDRVRLTVQQAIENKNIRSWRDEYRYKRADGSYCYVLDRAFLIRNQQGRAIRMIGAMQDVDKRRKYEDQLEYQNKILKEIAWQNSHELRRPLANILGISELLREEGLKEETHHLLLKLLNESANELDGIIRSIVKKSNALSGDSAN